jgi:DNA-binding LytR/AlgR family response regulator
MIIDDEPLQVELMSDYINRTPFLRLAASYNDPLKALAAIQEQNVQLVLMDIQMPELSGIQLRQLLDTNIKIIFISAHPAYALQGYDLDIVDYLLKPVSFERFLKAVKKTLSQFDQGRKLPEPMPGPTLKDSSVLFVKSGYKIMKIVINDILFVEGLKEYITIHLDHSKVIAFQTMKKMEEILPADHFIRVHKSYIVALNKISSVERNRIFINDKVVPIGETYRDAFFKFIER